MSLRADVLREIERRPRQLRDLKSKFRDEKKLIAVLGYLASDGLISLENGVYRKAKPQPGGKDPGLAAGMGGKPKDRPGGPAGGPHGEPRHDAVRPGAAGAVGRCPDERRPE